MFNNTVIKHVMSKNAMGKNAMKNNTMENNIMENNIKTFTTGEFSQRFGIKKDTLFYYDKIGLFQPAGVSDNGYRYYTVPQLDIFWMLQSLKELNFPLKTLEHYLKAPSPEELITLSKDQIERVNQEIKKLEQIHWLLSNMVTYTEEAINAPLDEIIFVELPKERVLYSEAFPYTNEFSDKDWFDFTDSFLKKADIKGPAFVGSVINQKDLMDGIYGKIDRLFLRRNCAKAKIKPSGLYAIIYHKGPYASAQDAYEPFLKSLKEQGLTICGDAYEEYLLDKLTVQNTTDFMIKISIPVKYQD